MTRPLQVAAIFLSVTLAACSSNPGATADAGNNDAGNNGDAGSGDAGSQDAGSSDAGGSCLPSQTYGGGETTMAGASVTATLVDQNGAAVPSQPTFICGLNLCSPSVESGAQGQVSISTNLSEKKAAFKFGDTLNYAEFAIPLAQATTAFGTLTTAIFPLSGPALTPGTTAVSGDLSLTLAAGAEVGIDTLVYSTPAQQEWRSAGIPVTFAAAQLASAPVTGFKLLYGIAPSETTVCPPAKVTVALSHAVSSPNDLGWAPNAAVEFWIMTTDTGQTYAPYAGWAKASDGAVSSDGTSVSTSDGQGFPLLENFAVRLH